jgi:hypothetical protein
LQSTSGDYNADGDNLDYPDVSSYNQLHKRKDFLNGIFGAFSPTGDYANIKAPTLGSEGNETFNGFRGPGYQSTDVALLKTTKIRERVSFQLRFDFFNVFNHPNLNGINSSLFDGNFGKSTAQFNPRWIEFGGKIQF